jgi:hypothetical protein
LVASRARAAMPDVATNAAANKVVKRAFMMFSFFLGLTAQ